MPRRLGDDPLARAKAPAEGAPVQAVQAPSRSSYNDVFFERRSPDDEPQAPAPTPDAPEISEISEIPHLKDAAAAAVEAPAPTPEPAPASAVAEVVAGPYAEPAPGASEVGDVPPERPGPPGPQAGDEESKGGFFKRLFGKLR